MLEKKSDNSNNNNLQIQLEEQLNSFSFCFYFLFFKDDKFFVDILDDKYIVNDSHFKINDKLLFNYNINKNLDIIECIIEKCKRKNIKSYYLSLNLLINLEIFTYQKYVCPYNQPKININQLLNEFLSIQVKIFYLSETSSNYATNNSLKDSNFLYYSNILKKLNLLNLDEKLYVNNTIYFISLGVFKLAENKTIKDFIVFYKRISLIIIVYVFYVEKLSFMLPENEDTEFLYNFLKELNVFLINKDSNTSHLLTGYDYIGDVFSDFDKTDLLGNFLYIETFVYTYLRSRSYINFDLDENLEKENFNNFYYEMINLINNYKMNHFLDTSVFKHFINFEKKLKFNLLEFFLNFEGSLIKSKINFDTDSNFLNFLTYKQLNKFSKNFYEEYFNTYSLDIEFKNKLLKLFYPLDLSFANLVWSKYFNIINFYINFRKPVKRNKNNIYKSYFRLDILDNISSVIKITYYYNIELVLNYKFNFLEIHDYVDYDFTYIYNKFKLYQNLSFDWSKITYSNYINNNNLFQFYHYFFGIFIFLQKILPITSACVYLYKEKHKKNKISNDFLIILDNLELFLNIFPNNFKNIELLINNTIGLMNIFETFYDLTEKHFNFYTNIPKLYSAYLNNIKTFKNIKVYKNYDDFSEKYKKLVIYIKIIKDVSKKNISSFINFLFLKKNFEKLIKINLFFQFTFFFDFRGRIYTYDSNYNWVSNNQLRPFIRIDQNLTTIDYFENFDYSNEIKEILIIFLKNNNFLFIKDLNSKDLKFLLNFVYINSLSLGMNLSKNKNQKEYIETFFNLYEKRSYNTLKLKIVTKILIFENNLNNLKDLRIFNECIYNDFSNITLSLDSVANGFTHILGLFKDPNKEIFLNYLKIANYCDINVKYDIYDILRENIYNFIDNDFGEQKKIFLKNYKKKIEVYLLKYSFLEKSLIELNLDEIISIIFNLKIILITRKLLKKPLMTILYSSRFKTWMEDISDTVFDDVFLENLNFISENADFLLLKNFFQNKTDNEIVKFLAYSITTIFSLKKNLIPMYDKLFNFSQKLKTEILQLTDILDIRFEINNKTNFSLLYFKEIKTKDFKISFFENKNRISYKEPNYISFSEFEDFNLNKIVNACLPNIIHSCDGYICLEVLNKLRLLNINCISVHDCFIFPWYSYFEVKRIYNETYFNFYNNFYIYSNIYVYGKDFKKKNLFDKYLTQNKKELNNINSFWTENKENIIKANYNLSFE